MQEVRRQVHRTRLRRHLHGHDPAQASSLPPCFIQSIRLSGSGNRREDAIYGFVRSASPL
ncbi:MAG: hypothetical protein BJ554DRAFT_7679 [Olpidium bornovanus]|uniref:Uncharacterized protein n=1 Tax=Olpidium bornovanus TaxID=278681 RepID=A0A8H7ZVS5_9FUNG|nr:MAG: hypothetical protein BJ554DRAFT_7679 [Olpidium bornovanus]